MLNGGSTAKEQKLYSLLLLLPFGVIVRVMWGNAATPPEHATGPTCGDDVDKPSLKMGEETDTPYWLSNNRKWRNAPAPHIISVNTAVGLETV